MPKEFAIRHPHARSRGVRKTKPSPAEGCLNTDNPRPVQLLGPMADSSEPIRGPKRLPPVQAAPGAPSDYAVGELGKGGGDDPVKKSEPSLDVALGCDHSVILSAHFDARLVLPEFRTEVW
jgi:hypothetical protein